MKNLGLRLTVTVIALCLVSAAIGCQSPAPAVPVPTPSLPAVASPALSPTPAPSLPAFKITSLSVEPKEAVAGGNVTIKARVENTGKGEGTYRAAPTVNGKIVETRDVPLTAGARQDLSFKVTTDAPGTYIITLGELTAMLKVLKPAKFRAASLNIEPKLIKTGDNMTVSVNVMNEGEANGTYLLSLMVDGKVIADKNVTLKGEATQPVNFTVRQDQPGIRNIEIDGLKDSVRVINYLRPTSGTYLFGEPDEGKIRTWYTILEVKNDWDSDVVAIITGTALPITPVTAFYVRAHSPGYGLFPRNNEYYLYLTQGKNWDNYTKEFATDKEYMRLPEKLTTWQYTFKLTLSGNITSKREGAQDVRLGSCKEEDFPRIK